MLILRKHPFYKICKKGVVNVYLYIQLLITETEVAVPVTIAAHGILWGHGARQAAFYVNCRRVLS
jgi:hypothetical protein